MKQSWRKLFIKYNLKSGLAFKKHELLKIRVSQCLQHSVRHCLSFGLYMNLKHRYDKQKSLASVQARLMNQLQSNHFLHKDTKTKLGWNFDYSRKGHHLLTLLITEMWLDPLILHAIDVNICCAMLHRNFCSLNDMLQWFRGLFQIHFTAPP